MLVKKCIDICKRAGCFCFYNTPEGQWLSDGCAVYPLFGVPHLDADTVCTMYDISETKKDKTHFKHITGLPETFDFGDIVASEKECGRIPIGVFAFGRNMMPFQCSTGAVYFDATYFEPLKDSAKGMLKVFERMTASGESYYVVKEGMCLVALILPVDAATQEMVKQLESLTALTALALENKRTAKELTLEEVSGA